MVLANTDQDQEFTTEDHIQDRILEPQSIIAITVLTQESDTTTSAAITEAIISAITTEGLATTMEHVIMEDPEEGIMAIGADSLLLS